MTLQISFVDSDRRAIALRLLFSRFPIAEQQQKLAETKLSVERGSLNLDGLLLAEENQVPVGVSLMMIQRDGIALVWPPIATCQATAPTEVEDALMRRLCVEIDRSGSKLSQALLMPEELAEADLLKRHGFDSQGEIFFVARSLTPADYGSSSVCDPDLTFETFNESNAHRFAATIERTYQESIDCPFLNGFRNGESAILSHQLSGRFDPAGWRLYGNGSEDFGVFLVNEHPDNDALELVYFGIVPEFRGRGLGRRVLAHGIQAAAMTGRMMIFLTVDSGNIYANTLYDELGFAEVARRQIFIRRS